MPVACKNAVSAGAIRLLASLVFLAGANSELLAGPVAISWHGQSFFEVVSSGGVRLALDPHAIESYGRRSMKVDAVLLSHRHTDHNRMDPIENPMQVKVLEGLKAAGPGGRAVFNPVDEKIKDVRVRDISCFHDAVQGMKRGLNTIWVVPVGGVYTLNGLDAKKVVDQIKPTRFVIPMHYGTRVYSDLLGPDAFLGEFEDNQILRIKGQTLKVDPAEKNPSMKVGVLGFEPVGMP